jgi:hypothetical protein
MTGALLRRVRPFDVIEPCAGGLAIANVLTAEGLTVVTNDADPSRPTQFHLDMTRRESWQTLTYPFIEKRVVWGVTNLPFNMADEIVPLAVEHRHSFAWILRLSWLEPTGARQRFLAAHPPAKVIVLPRHDFKGRGSTDSVTSAWFVWGKWRSAIRSEPIEIVTKDERDELIAMGKR